MTIAEALRRFRENYGLTQKQVADKIGVYTQAYSALEHSKKGEIIPRVDTLIKIAQAFNVSLDYLAGLSDDPRPVKQVLEELGDAAPVEVSEELTLESLQAEIKKMQIQLHRQQDEINDLRVKFFEL